jgi:hypothetical protein
VFLLAQQVFKVTDFAAIWDRAVILQIGFLHKAKISREKPRSPAKRLQKTPETRPRRGAMGFM